MNSATPANPWCTEHIQQHFIQQVNVVRSLFFHDEPYKSLPYEHIQQHFISNKVVMVFRSLKDRIMHIATSTWWYLVEGVKKICCPTISVHMFSEKPKKKKLYLGHNSFNKKYIYLNGRCLILASLLYLMLRCFHWVIILSSVSHWKIYSNTP